MESIPAAESLKILLKNPDDKIAAVDVRSASEFTVGAVPGFASLPILTDDERHQVGTCYKLRGQKAAIELGHALVDPHRAERVRGWRALLAQVQVPLVACWRGGLRSRIACEWIRENGGRAIRVEGGYKALRGLLLETFNGLPEMLVLSGPTGSGKTELLEGCPVPRINLEKLACHRGSAFGGFVGIPQPSQASFENALAFSIRRQSKRVLVEDESLMIGQVHVPVVFKEQMRQSPVVRIQMSLDERVGRILQDYVLRAVQGEITGEKLAASYESNLLKIQRKLGGLKTAEIQTALRQAFATGDEERHRFWIRELLLHYYDKTYEFAFQRTKRPVVFQGDPQACRQWIRDQFV